MGLTNEQLMALLNSEVISRVVAGLEPPETTILDTVFKTRRTLSDIYFRLNELVDDKRILKFVHPNVPAPEFAGDSWTERSYEVPLMKVKKQWTLYDLRKISALPPRDAAEVIRDRLQAMKNSITRTLEVLASKAFTGTIVHKMQAEVEVDVKIEYGTPQSYTPSTKWNQSGSDPIKDIRAMKRLIAKNTPFSRVKQAFVGYEAMDALLSNSKVRELIKQGKGVEIAETGRIKVLAGVELIEVIGTYKDFDGTVKHFIDPKEIVMWASDAPFALAIAPVDAWDGPRVGLYARTDKLKDDPDGIRLLLMTRQIPVVGYAPAIVRATVV